MNELFLDALRCENRSRPPVWLMRQAGRYMPEYRALRKKHDLLTMFHEPELISQVTRLPIDMLGVDAAILFADILLVCESLGKKLRFEEGRGPVISEPLRCAADVDQLPPSDVSWGYRGIAEGIRLLKADLEVPLIGFSGAPFTIASYLIEGGSSKHFLHTRKWAWSDPESFHRLLERVSDSIIEALNLQIDAGVDAIQIFDSWAQVLNQRDFRSFCLPYYRRIMDGLSNPDIPVILFGRGSSVFYREMATVNPAAVSVDWNCDLRTVRDQVPSHIAVQGNLDPYLLYAPEAVLRERVEEILQNMEGEPGYIFNLGHGIFPDVPVSSVRLVVDTIKSSQLARSS